MPNFGDKSSKVKATINPLLAWLCDRVVVSFDIALLSGIRDKEEQNNAFNLKLSQKQWPDSAHNVDESCPFPENLSMAVDATPFPIPKKWGKLKARKVSNRDLEWKERVKFYQMAAVFKYEFIKLQIEYPPLLRYKLVFGVDWDGDGDYKDQKWDDLCHLELVEI